MQNVWGSKWKLTYQPKKIHKYTFVAEGLPHNIKLTQVKAHANSAHEFCCIFNKAWREELWVKAMQISIETLPFEDAVRTHSRLALIGANLYFEMSTNLRKSSNLL